MPGAKEDFIPQNKPGAFAGSKGALHERHPGLPAGHRRHCRLVAVAAEADVEALARSRASIAAISPAPSPDDAGGQGGLGVFLAVVGCLFALFTSAYFMRMGLSDWHAMPVPRLLWLNTGVLVLSSVALQMRAAVAARRRPARYGAGSALSPAGLTAVAFLVGQLMAWRELVADGYFLASNPANSFFYLITGMHGLHIIGGLVGARPWSRQSVDAANGGWSGCALSVELCAMYWHFLLFIWLGRLRAAGRLGRDFIDICRQLLT